LPTVAYLIYCSVLILFYETLIYHVCYDYILMH